MSFFSNFPNLFNCIPISFHSICSIFPSISIIRRFDFSLKLFIRIFSHHLRKKFSLRQSMNVHSAFPLHSSVYPNGIFGADHCFFSNYDTCDAAYGDVTTLSFYLSNNTLLLAFLELQMLHDSYRLINFILLTHFILNHNSYSIGFSDFKTNSRTKIWNLILSRFHTCSQIDADAIFKWAVTFWAIIITPFSHAGNIQLIRRWTVALTRKAAACCR